MSVQVNEISESSDSNREKRDKRGWKRTEEVGIREKYRFT